MFRREVKYLPGKATLGKEEKIEFEKRDEWDGDMKKYLRRQTEVIMDAEEIYSFSSSLPEGITEKDIPSDEWIVLDVDNGDYLSFAALCYTM